MPANRGVLNQSFRPAATVPGYASIAPNLCAAFVHATHGTLGIKRAMIHFQNIFHRGPRAKVLTFLAHRPTAQAGKGMEAADTREAGNLANRFYLHLAKYFRFISEPGIEPTNNLAEQVQRFVTIHRRMTQGTRSERGRQWWERMCTTVATCAQQARSSFTFLCDCVAAWIIGQAAPSLTAPCLNTS
jgi:hypothetical protein